MWSFFAIKQQLKYFCQKKRIKTFPKVIGFNPKELKKFINKKCKKLKVSRLALLIRLKNLSLIKHKVFEALKKEYIEEFEQQRKRLEKKMKKE